MRKPGIDSSLSSVPPVWPSPRPDIIGTATPSDATSGARTMRDLVADAAGGVLVDARPSEVARDRASSPLRSMASVSACVSARSRPRRKHAIRKRGHLVVGHVAGGVRVGERAPLARLDAAAVPLPFDQPQREH